MVEETNENQFNIHSYIYTQYTKYTIQQEIGKHNNKDDGIFVQDEAGSTTCWGLFIPTP